MASRVKRSTGAVSAFIIATATTIGVILAGISVIGKMTLTQKMDSTSIDICIPILLLLATLIGGQVLLRITDGVKIYTILFGGMMIIIIVAGGCAIDGVFQNIVKTLGAVIIGSAVSFAISLKKRGKHLRKK